MNERENVLYEALQKNEQESQRWKAYLKENETAIDNMIMFGKRLSVDVMVPIGSKAFMPGHLLHTNEVLVGHYQGYFSKCTVFKAQEICELRIKMAKEHIKKLEMEADLWQNKLDKPYAEGVVPSGEEREIVEEFNEEKENLWKKQHKIRVKQAKQKEREEREQQREIMKDRKTTENINENIFKKLEEAELMEELQQELETLQIDEVNDETIRKLMSGEMQIPKEKMRVAHDKKPLKEHITGKNVLSKKIVKIKDIENSGEIRTNNNVYPNEELLTFISEDEAEEETLPEEVKLIKQQAQYLGSEDQISFYDYQIKIIRQRLLRLPLRTLEGINKKIHLLNILEHLEELLEEAEEIVGEAELAEKDSNEEQYKKFEEKLENPEQEFIVDASDEYNINNKSNQKRRISFALEDQTLEFRKHEAVTQMFPSKIENHERDIIKLSDNDEEKNKNNVKLERSPNKQVLIQSKVDKNFQFVAENQSKQDFDLVQQILQSSNGDINTLHIKFSHSTQEGFKSKAIFNSIGSPADIYNIYNNAQKSAEPENETLTYFINSYQGEEKVKTAILKECDRQEVFTDPKSEFSNPLQAKSILKNKCAVINENHCESNKENTKLKKKPTKKEDDYLSAYYKVMNDVVEKPLAEPEPLPDGKFIDAHTPKKRVSRYKQMRQGNGKT